MLVFIGVGFPCTAVGFSTGVVIATAKTIDSVQYPFSSIPFLFTGFFASESLSLDELDDFAFDLETITVDGVETLTGTLGFFLLSSDESDDDVFALLLFTLTVDWPIFVAKRIKTNPSVVHSYSEKGHLPFVGRGDAAAFFAGAGTSESLLSLDDAVFLLTIAVV